MDSNRIEYYGFIEYDHILEDYYFTSLDEANFVLQNRLNEATDFDHAVIMTGIAIDTVDESNTWIVVHNEPPIKLNDLYHSYTTVEEYIEASSRKNVLTVDWLEEGF